MGEVLTRGFDHSPLLLNTVDFRNRFPLRLWRPDAGEEVDSELEFHLEMRTREHMARGMSECEARRLAFDKFGDYPRARRECRALSRRREQHMRLTQFAAELRQDAGFAFRHLLAAPGFTLIAIATLAVGIGATTAIFSAVHAVVLRPLPIAEPERLVVVSSGWREGLMSMAPAHYLHLAQEQTVFESLAAAESANFTLARQEGAERLIGARVTGGYFDVFGVQPVLGRTFGDMEDVQGRDQVVVLSHGLWSRQFAADPGIVGRDVALNGRPHTVIGVMPPIFKISNREEDLWVPIAFPPERRSIRTSHFLRVYARLRPDIGFERAAATLPAIVQRRIAIWPDEPAERTLHITPLHEQLVGNYRQRLFVLLGAVAFVLLIACGNISTLVLARGAGRAREIAVRAALGAGQSRLLRQLLTESVVLALLAALAGIALARWLISGLLAFSPAGVPRLEETHIDAVVLCFAVGLSLLSSVLFGSIPAWRASRLDLNSTLKEGGRGPGMSQTRDGVRATLIAGEVALAFTLLVGAGLLIRTSLEMQRIRPGFDPAGVFTGRVLLPASKYTAADPMLRVVTELEEAAHAIPGVSAAAVASTVPGVRAFSNGLLPEGRELSLENITQSDGVLILPRYFETMRLAIVRGRPFDERDRSGAPLVVILNRTAAALMWPGEDAIGKRLTSANPLGPTTVVGIAEDVRLDGPSQPAPPTFYVPLAQANDEVWSSSRSFYIVARTDGNLASIGAALRHAVSTVDPGIPLFDTRTMEQRMAATIEPARFNTLLLSLLGGAGLLLASIGIYGVVSYFAAQRTSEIGIRVALGATRGEVMRLVIRQAMLPVSTGVVLGTLGAMFASRAISSHLVNVRTTDTATFVAVAGTLLAAGLMAAFVPARRAARTDPARTLNAS